MSTICSRNFFKLTLDIPEFTIKSKKTNGIFKGSYENSLLQILRESFENSYHIFKEL